MSVNEILAELETLSPDELKVIQDKLNLINEDFEETPEGRRSLREEPTFTLEEIRKEIPTWTMDTK